MILDAHSDNMIIVPQSDTSKEKTLIRMTTEALSSEIQEEKRKISKRYSNGTVQEVNQKVKNANDDKIEDTVIFYLQKDPTFEKLNYKKLIKELEVEHADVLYFLKGDEFHTKRQKESIFIHNKLDEKLRGMKNSITLKIPFKEFCKATNIKAFSRPSRMVNAIDSFKKSTEKQIYKKMVNPDGNQKFLKNDNNIFFRNEDNEYLPLTLKKGKWFLKGNIEVTENIFFKDENDDEFPILYSENQKKWYYFDRTGSVYPRIEDIGGIKGISYDFIPEASQLFDDLDINDHKEWKERFLNAKIRNKYQYFTDLEIDINTNAIFSLLGLGKDFGYLVKPFREEFERTYTFRLDEIIRKNIHQMNKKNIDHIDLDSIEILKKEMNATDMTNHHFKSNVLTPTIKEFNKCTKDMQILSIENENVHTMKDGYQKKVRIKLDREDVESWKDYIYVKINEMLISTDSKNKIKNVKGFKQSIWEILWNTSDPVWYNKPISVWRNEAKQELSIVPTVKEVVSFLKTYGVNIDYDEAKYKISYLEEGSRKSFSGVTKPSLSLKYILDNINEVNYKTEIEDYSDAIFCYKDNAIFDIETLKKHKKSIMKDISEKNISNFTPYREKTEAYDELIEKIRYGQFFDAVSEIKKALEKIDEK